LNRGLLWILVAVGILALLLATVAIGSRDEDEPVTAGEWAQNICGAVGAWRGELESIVDDVRKAPARGATGTAEPQSETPQGRTALVRQGLERAVEATKTMVDAVDHAGIPQTDGGEAAADEISNWADTAVDNLEEAEDALDDEADSTEASIEQYSNAAQAIGETLVSGARTVAEIGRANPELRAAVRTSSTCRELPQEALAR
jgi:hypothetical protein